ncbi:probable glutamate--tRNA ligase, mitochondrial [Anneissia japonica]|uniref:probable glutamate--tRNA ligase, mitochondrial n=1 Tax=Anneissia japonica TaxID=1529436 RepID=UPI001425A565|nr:probable glutamate--tRNA ligase, mitochondrial [Anneissia japonica]
MHRPQAIPWLAYQASRCYTTSSPCYCVKQSVRVRFAPSPTGMMHLGGLRTALYNYIYAKSFGGKFILRIEDTDQGRLVEGAVDNIEQTITWAGMPPDEGPSVGGSYGPYVQSKRLHIYNENINILLQNGTAYRCFCSPQRLNLLRKEALRHRQVPRYDNRCRSLSEDQVQRKMNAGEMYVVRFKLNEEVEYFEDLVYGRTKHETHTIEGDPVLLKSDKFPTYHFANVVDDHLMNITHVLRGMEWLTSTSKHLLIYKAFEWTPPTFAHLPLLMNKDGSKLSKRQGDIFVEKFKDSGFLPEALLNFITSCGSGYQDNKSIKDLNELIKQFSIDKVTTHSATLDMEQLLRINRGHICQKLIDDKEQHNLIKELKAVIHKKLGNRISTSQVLNLNEDYLLKVLQFRKDHISKLEDLVADEYMWIQPNLSLHHFTNVSREAEKIISMVEADFQCCDKELFREDELAKRLKSISQRIANLKPGEFWKTLRFALSGITDGPSLKEMFTILGKEESLRRLQAAAALFKDS